MRINFSCRKGDSTGQREGNNGLVEANQQRREKMVAEELFQSTQVMATKQAKALITQERVRPVFFFFAEY